MPVLPHVGAAETACVGVCVIAEQRRGWGVEGAGTSTRAAMMKTRSRKATAARHSTSGHSSAAPSGVGGPAKVQRNARKYLRRIGSAHVRVVAHITDGFNGSEAMADSIHRGRHRPRDAVTQGAAYVKMTSSESLRVRL